MSRSAIVTGAGAGMGAKIAQLLAERSYHLTLIDRDGGALEATAQSLRKSAPEGVVVRTGQCDVTDSAQLLLLFIEHATSFGGVDVVVNNAGIAERGDMFSDHRQDSNWRLVLDIDLAAVIEGTRLAVNLMTTKNEAALRPPPPPPATATTLGASATPEARAPQRFARGGVVVNVASAAGLFPMPFAPVYAAAKAGVVMFCRSLESLTHREGTPVAVRAFCPEFVDTAFVADALSDLEERASASPPSSTSTTASAAATASVAHSNIEPPLPHPLPLVLPVISPSALIATTGGRLITVDEAARACVELLVDPGPLYRLHHKRARDSASSPQLQVPLLTCNKLPIDSMGPPSCALLLTTRGPRWWHFGNGRGGGGRRGGGVDNPGSQRNPEQPTSPLRQSKL